MVYTKCKKNLLWLTFYFAVSIYTVILPSPIKKMWTEPKQHWLQLYRFSCLLRTPGRDCGSRVSPHRVGCARQSQALFETLPFWRWRERQSDVSQESVFFCLISVSHLWRKRASFYCPHLLSTKMVKHIKQHFGIQFIWFLCFKILMNTITIFFYKLNLYCVHAKQTCSIIYNRGNTFEWKTG